MTFDLFETITQSELIGLEVELKTQRDVATRRIAEVTAEIEKLQAHLEALKDYRYQRVIKLAELHDKMQERGMD